MSVSGTPIRARLELWQAEWCPASHRVRERLTELGLSFLARQVPAEREERKALEAATGQTTIPVLVADGEALCGEETIARYLQRRFAEPPGAISHREKAARARRKELERACPELAAATR